MASVAGGVCSQEACARGGALFGVLRSDFANKSSAVTHHMIEAGLNWAVSELTTAMLWRRSELGEGRRPDAGATQLRLPAAPLSIRIDERGNGMLRILAIVFIAGVAGCAELDRAVTEQGQYNSQRCSAYGWPGSPAYSACISQGANYRPASTLSTAMPDQTCRTSSKTVKKGDEFNSTTTTTSNTACY